ncbi:hypothetical protein [Streptomyces sp. SPB162]|uniref:hypothetical protein n=1 Tax=Streptomyces sp. SPB162 TaxID=2940560 RepID=UPI0024060701|nr:hypothetical protein [Streptomyces sp. SPB162]MDF9813092.1 GNAT superfamily N-acetyltransferase [Streptomyces sp. SPB162]
MRTAVVPVEEIFELRWAVLRTGLPRETAIYPEDSRESTFHVAAYDDEGAVQACVTFFPDTLPGEDVAAYRFRGMGSGPEVRGAGYGAAVLRAGARRGHGPRRRAGVVQRPYVRPGLLRTPRVHRDGRGVHRRAERTALHLLDQDVGRLITRTRS